MPSVNLLELALSAQQFWLDRKRYYLNLHPDRYTQQYISEQLARCDQNLEEIQVLITENLVAWAARRPPPPQQ